MSPEEPQPLDPEMDDDPDVCETCGGDGVVEYADHPEVWGEDCPSEVNHLVTCPECAERERRERWEKKRQQIEDAAESIIVAAEVGLFQGTHSEYLNAFATVTARNERWAREEKVKKS